MSEYYYSENPVSEIREKSFIQNLNGSALSFTSVSGVFSFEEKVDKASELLIRNFQPSGASILDVGCGYGAIGLFIKATYQYLGVFMCDINNRAVAYSQKNALANKLTVSVLKSDLFSAFENQLFDDIVANPPFAAGKALNIQLIEKAWDHLNPGGGLWLTAHHNKGGSTLKEIMKSKFGNAEDVEKSGGIRVYKSVRQAY